MKWLVLSSAVLSCLSNMFSMIGYECIALAGENYKLRRRCIRFGGFLIFLSGNGCPQVGNYMYSMGVLHKTVTSKRR